MYAPWAAALAEHLLAEALPDRWAHYSAVGAYARALAELAGEDADVLEAAAYLHDVGYAPSARETGFHPLDGARYLRDRTEAPPLLQVLVANHTGALVEARHRGLGGTIESEFPVGPTPQPNLLALITHCDLCVSPTGRRVSPEERIAEILRRYSEDHPVHQAVRESSPLLLSQDRQVRSLLDGGDASHSRNRGQ